MPEFFQELFINEFVEMDTNTWKYLFNKGEVTCKRHETHTGIKFHAGIKWRYDTRGEINSHVAKKFHAGIKIYTEVTTFIYLFH